MTDLIGELRARRLVKELDPIRRPGAGRPTRPIAFDGEPWGVLGVQIDLDAVQFACSTVGGRELWHEVVRTDLAHHGPQTSVSAFCDLLRAQLSRMPGETRLVSIEIGVPGYVARDRGTVSWAPGLQWRDVDLAAAVHGVLDEIGAGAHVGVSNACHLAALHVTRLELPLAPDSIVAYLGGVRSIGSGLIIDGEIFRGADGGAGDFGHHSVADDGPECWCGRRGCLESLAGPRALLIGGGLCSADEATQLVEDQPLKAIQLITEAADAGETSVLSALETSAAALGATVDDVIGMFNPHAVVLGGFLGALSGYLLPVVRDRIADRLTISAFAATELASVELGVSRVLGGAVLAARDACFYDPVGLTQPV